MTADDNGSETPDLIQQTLEPLLPVHEQLMAEQEQLEMELRTKKEEVQRVEKLLRDAQLIEPKKKSKSSKAHLASYGRVYVSAEMLEHARANIPDGDFTIRQLATNMGTAEGTAKKALESLRAEREIRLLGIRKTEKGHKAAHYTAVIDDA